tara:strand:- start:19077 stop:19898 length:822 start_codon:yes stop_codon:yes gene_type:complete
MKFTEIVDEIKNKRSYLCIGLDSDLDKIPEYLKDMEDPIFEFNKRVIDATKDLVIAYKPNIAFYESMGPSGLSSLSKTLEYIPKNIFKIADAKRGDIGNTSRMYAKTFFETYNFDAVTLSPYMGEDTSKPFLEYDKKWIILLTLTSNKSSTNIQHYTNSENEKLYSHVIKDSLRWSDEMNTMYVVGANRIDEIREIRKIIPKNFILIPGVGAQGGNLKEISSHSMNNNCGIIVNVSRDIIYADSSTSFESNIREKALIYKNQMELILNERGLI